MDGHSSKCRPELGSQASCPEALREERRQAQPGAKQQRDGRRILEEAPPPRSPQAWGLTGLPRAPPGGCGPKALSPGRKPPGARAPTAGPTGTSQEGLAPRAPERGGKGRQPCSTVRPEDAALGQCGQRRRPERARHTAAPAGETTRVGAAQLPGQETMGHSCLCHQLQAGAPGLKGGRLPALTAAGSLSQATPQTLTPCFVLTSPLV